VEASPELPEKMQTDSVSIERNEDQARKIMMAHNKIDQIIDYLKAQQ